MVMIWHQLWVMILRQGARSTDDLLFFVIRGSSLQIVQAPWPMRQGNQQAVIRWFMSSGWRCSGTKLQMDFKCVAVRQRWRKEALELLVHDEAKVSLKFELSTRSSTNNGELDNERCPENLDFQPALMWAIAVDFWEPSNQSCFHDAVWLVRNLQKCPTNAIRTES